MLEALKIFDHESSDQELKKAKEEMTLIRIRYYINLGQINYIKGNFPEAKKWIDEGYSLAGDEKNYTYETVEDFKKHAKELEGMRIKCEAKVKGVSSYDLKRELAKTQPKVETEEDEVPQGTLVPMIGCFGLTSATAFALTFAIMKAASK